MLSIPGYYYIASAGQVRDAISKLEKAPVRPDILALQSDIDPGRFSPALIRDYWKRFVHLDRSFAQYATVTKAIKWGLPRDEQAQALHKVNQAYIQAKQAFSAAEIAIYTSLFTASENHKVPVPSNVQSVYIRQMYSGSRWSYSYRIFFTILISVIAAAAAAKLGYENELRNFVKKACITTGQAAASLADTSLRTISFLVQKSETQAIILGATGLWTASEIAEWASEKLGSLMREYKWTSAALLTSGATAIALNEPLQKGIKYVATSKIGFKIGIISAAIASFTLAKKLVGPYMPGVIYQFGEQISSIPRATLNFARSLISQRTPDSDDSAPPAADPNAAAPAEPANVELRPFTHV